MSTRAIKFLQQNGVPFEVMTYAHEEKGAEFASKAIDFPLEQTIKTLVVDLGNSRCALVLMPGDRRLALKDLVTVFSVKRIALADQAIAEKVTGYHVGGISPFGTTRKLPVVMEESLMTFEKVAINGGKRGVMLMMKPKDIAKTLGCKVLRAARR